MKAVLFVVGLLVVFGGVGSVETQPTITSGIIVAAVGLLMMYYGVKRLQAPRRTNYFHERL